MSAETLLKILAACERTGAAVERFVGIAEERQRERTEPKQKRAPKDLLTVTGKVTAFSLVTGRDGSPILTKKEQKMHKLKLDNGFEATIFGDDSKKINPVAEAFRSGAPVEIAYTVNGQYNNIDSIKLGAAPAKAAVEDDEVPF